MNWLFRPSFLLVIALVLVAGAAAFVLIPLWEDSRGTHPVPMPVAQNEREIVWLYAATNATPWERFVSAATRAQERLAQAGLCPGIRLNTSMAFPQQTATVPQFTLSLPQQGKLVFRWYKLTSNMTTAQWIEALCERRPPPLAIIGGSSSDLAIDLARALRQQSDSHADIAPPVMLLTSATADRDFSNTGPEAPLLNEIHAGRTFRFCFTNRQMADAVTDFIWSRAELRPDMDPVYVTLWRDDAYSLDLTDRFFDALRRRSGAPAGGMETLPISEYVDYSVGSFDQPNQWEELVVRRLMEAKTQRFPNQQRPLLILPGASTQPMRRVLRGLTRTAPEEARKFVVATGDALPFNTVYRDRNVLWPIQDLPFDLVLFCHRNPVEAEVGFAEEDGPDPSNPDRGSGTTGTEDLLLDRDIIETLAQCLSGQGPSLKSGDDLGNALKEMRWHEGKLIRGSDGPKLFDDHGNRATGSGEHVVWIHPITEMHRVEPKARISVYTPGRPWTQVRALEVDYDLSRRGR